MTRRILALSVALVAATSALEASAQDVEALGRAYGTRPPDAYFQARRDHPGAFRFSRGWGRRIGAPLLIDSEGTTAHSTPAAAPLGERPGGITGDLAFPLVLGLFSDSPETPPQTTEQIQDHFFDGPNTQGTIPAYYAEQSGGLLNLRGETHAWKRSTLSQDQVTGGVAGLSSPGKVGSFIIEVLTDLDDGEIDWGAFDNDGPDGQPNSGDDDGYVDVLAVMHPTAGAECSGNMNRVWSHRWQLRFAAGREFPTKTASASTRPGAPTLITINDYTIQPAMSCTPGSINEIGVFAHELGHGLGLPDLYDTFSGDGQHGAAGRWDLMATGSWGCRGGNPARPCHLSAWSKAVLGWLEVETLTPDVDHGVLSLDPVESALKVFRIDSGDASDEYFLLENRTRSGFDEEIFAEGLLVWHIDQSVLDNRWSSNSVNTDAERMGVWLRAADGLDQGAASGDHRGDGGDVFPGATANTAFHAGTNPASFSHAGRSAGLTIFDIVQVGAAVEFRVLTRYQTLTLRSGGTNGAPVTVSVDGGPAMATEVTVASAPFQVHAIEAGPGGLVAPGVRAGFLAWEDGSPRIREFATTLGDSVLVATYGGDLEMLLTVSQVSAAPGVDPGQVDLFPGSVDGWYDEGAEVSITAMARTGFSFREWSGDLAGSPNPVNVTMTAPVTATAEYDVTFGVASTPNRVPIEAATASEVILLPENANLPVTWAITTGELPHGMQFIDDGTIRGIALDPGIFVVGLLARDAIGLEAALDLTLDVAPPNIGSEALTAPFFSVAGGPTVPQHDYLDRHGNANGRYDLGDFRAFVLSNRGLPAQSTLGEPVARTTVTIPFRAIGKQGR